MKNVCLIVILICTVTTSALVAAEPLVLLDERALSATKPSLTAHNTSLARSWPIRAY